MEKRFFVPCIFPERQARAIETAKNQTDKQNHTQATP
jgi:hypothetical protein